VLCPYLAGEFFLACAPEMVSPFSRCCWIASLTVYRHPSMMRRMAWWQWAISAALLLVGLLGVYAFVGLMWGALLDGIIDWGESRAQRRENRARRLERKAARLRAREYRRREPEERRRQ
jgi:hypothetical protein